MSQVVSFPEKRSKKQSQANRSEVVAFPVQNRAPAFPLTLVQADTPAKLRLLVVDDDEADREAVRRALGESGLEFELTEATGEQDGLHELRNHNYDCVLLDYRFPRGDAFDLFADILTRPCDNRPPVVILTGVGNEEIAAGSIKRGAQDYLRKAELTAAGLRHSVESVIEFAGLQRTLKRQNDMLHRMGLYDSLTDLPNRNLFFSRLEQKLKECERRNESFALLMMDLNGFKEVNDTLGHAAGDQVLRLVARRLTDAVRQSDTISRLGGDEFAGILTLGEHGEDIVTVAEKLCRVIDEPMTVRGKRADCGLSMGIAIYPRDGDDGELLLRLADTAMYLAKRRSTGYAIHGGLIEGALSMARQVRRDLGQGPDLKQFCVEYQPQVDLVSARVVGVEALVRWQHPQYGTLLPEQFLGTAQCNAVLRDLTLHVLARAAQQNFEWLVAGVDIPLSINLAPSLLTDNGLPEAILECIAKQGLEPGRLTLEVTETGVMTVLDQASNVLQALNEAGVRTSIDDFGAGYSSFKNLREFPVAEIKIDRMFVHQAESNDCHASIVRSLVELGKGLGARVVAEGVETEATRRYLRKLGCRFGQGYLFSKPLAADAYLEWHRNWRANRSA